jgi:outer membrane protein OmpA-like peptidoglycan-associated protein
VKQFHSSKNLFMKKVLLFVLSCVTTATIYSQSEKIVKDHYTASGGLLAAADFSKFRLNDKATTNINYDLRAGWSGGGWLNLPVSTVFSIEPQLMYSSYSYRSKSTTQQTLLNNGKVKYFSVPLLLKFDASDKFAIAAGPQVDFVSSVEDNSVSNAQKSDFKKASFSGFAGLEVFPHGKVTIFGRYIHGFSNLNNVTSGERSGVAYKNQVIQAGLKLKLFGKKEGTYKATTVVVPLDTDGDGITDDVDKCPNTPGVAKYNGCPIPDSDNDGINDELDKCPNVPGLAKYNGCPIPDSDNDGINDEEDKCPNVPGLAKYNGCPAPDRDNDGINDDEDKCPDVPGVASNNGCPEVPADVNKLFSSSAQHLSFGTNSAKLTSTSSASLNQVVKAMKEHPELKIKLEGHADNAEKNSQEVSEARAAAIKTYLVSKGIDEDRITVEGFGSTMPIADNSTPAGRTQNRRVEIKVNY